VDFPVIDLSLQGGADPMKMLLIATTALVCVTSLAMAATLPDRQIGSSHSGLTTNEEFLCNYGFQLQVHASSGFPIYTSTFDRAATPVIGKGKSVNEITVKDNPSYSEFQVSIYTSYLNKPNTKLVSAYAMHGGCGRVNVAISPITLEYGKKYWIVQRALPHWSSSGYIGTNSILWLYDKNGTHGALWQDGSTFCSSGGCSRQTGPWTHITGGVPFARVRESVGASELNHLQQSQAASDGPGDGSISPVVVPKRRGGHEGSIPRYPP
jgi:hypothetical protein